MIEFIDKIQKNPRLLRLKNPKTAEIIDWEIQDLASDEIAQEGTEITANVLNQAFLNMHPIGCLYVSLDKTNPSQLFGGTWELVGKDLVLIGAGNKYKLGATVGNSSISLTSKNIPAHSHSIPSLNGSTNNTGSHSHTGRYAQYGAGGSKLVLRRISNEDDYKGEAQITDNAGAHSHTVTTNASNTGSTGNGAAFDITPRGLAVYFWNRIS